MLKVINTSMQLRCLCFVEVYSKGKAYGNASVDIHDYDEKLKCDVFPDLCPVPEHDHLGDPDPQPPAGGGGAGQLPAPPTLPPPRPAQTAGAEAQLLGVHRSLTVVNENFK